MPVLVLAGEEEFELSRALQKLKADLLDPAWLSFNLVKLKDASLQELIDAAGALPFGPGKKLVLIEDCDFFTKKRGKADEEGKAAATEKAVKQALEDLDRALSVVSADTYVVFACPYNFDKTLRLSKVVSKYAKITEFSKVKHFPGSDTPSSEMRAWFNNEVKRFHVSIDDAAISYLLESTDANLRLISSEIEKAAVYLLPQKHITLEVVSKLSSHHSHVFSLLEDFAAQRHKQALTRLEELLAKQSGLPIIGLLHTTLGKWIRLKGLVGKLTSEMPGNPGQAKRALSAAELAGKLAPQLSQHPYVVEKELGRIKELSAELLISKRVQLSALDKMVKTGQMSDRHALTLFLSN